MGKRKTISDIINEAIAKRLAVWAFEKFKESEMLQALNGFKTYIIAAFLLLGGAMESLGWDIPQFELNFATALPIAIALITARSGAKADAKAVASRVGLSM